MPGEHSLRAGQSASTVEMVPRKDGSFGPDLPWWMAFHEAGHVVVADALGMHVEEVIVDSEKIAVVIESPQSGFIDAAISHAGGLSQMMAGEPPGHGTIQDLEHAREAIVEHVGEDEGDIHRETLRASNLANALLVALWSRVEALAAVIQHFGGSVPKTVMARCLEPCGHYMDFAHDCEPREDEDQP